MKNFISFLRDNIVVILLTFLLVMAARNAIVSTYARDHVMDIENKQITRDNALETKLQVLELKIKLLEEKKK